MVAGSTLKRIAAVGGVAAIGAAVWMQFRVQSKFREQGFYKKSIRMLRESKGAQEVMGLPIWDKRVDLADDFHKVDVKEAQVKVPVSGPKTKGHLYSWSTRDGPGAEWIVDRLELEVESNKGFHLLVYDRTKAVAPPAA